MYNTYIIKSSVLVFSFSSFLISIYIKNTYPGCHLSKAAISRSPPLIPFNHEAEGRMGSRSLKPPIVLAGVHPLPIELLSSTFNF